MSGLDDFMANLGFGTSKATKNASQDVNDAQQYYAGLETPNLTPEQAQTATASQVGPNAYDSVSTDPSNKAAQQAQMAALQRLSANGGRSAASDANLAGIEANENQNAKAQRDAVMAGAARRGQGGSGASLLAQLDSSQGAVNRQSAEDLGVAGQEAQTGIQAGQAAAGIGAGLESQDFGEKAARASAQNSINQFNAGNSTGVSEYNAGQGNNAQQFNSGLQQQGYQDQFQKAQGQANTAMGAANYWSGQSAIGAQQAGNVLGSAVKLGTAAAPTAGAAFGGRIPGSPRVPGDSPVNDTQMTPTSPGEVVVPRSLAQGGSPGQIGQFVKQAPPTTAPDRQKEATLSALKRLRAKGIRK